MRQIDTVDLRHRLCHGHDPAMDLHLPREMVAARLHRFEAHQQPGLGLCLCARQFGRGQIVSGAGEHFAGEREGTRRIRLGRRAIDAKLAAIRRRRTPGIDRIGEPRSSRTSWNSRDDMPPPAALANRLSP